MLTAELKAELDEFLATSRIAIVATNSSTGFPQVTPNWFNWDGERLSISTTKDRLKYKILRYDPKMTVLIYAEPMASDYVLLRGHVKIQDDDGIWGPTRTILERHMTADEVDTYIEQMQKAEPRVLLWLTPESASHRLG